MSDEFDLSGFQTQLEQLEWIKIRKAELAELEHQVRSSIEENLPPVRSDRDNQKIVGTLDGKPYLEWRGTKTNRLNQRTLKSEFPAVHAYCTEEVYGRSMHILNGQDNA